MTGCQVHRNHRPLPHRIVTHHIWPKAMGGPNQSANRVEVCDTGHYNIHSYLVELIRADGNDTAVDDRHWAKTERRLARQGFDQWVAAGKPGRPEAIAVGGLYTPVPVVP